MIFGLQLSSSYIMYGGAVVFVMLIFELLVGLRVIKFKGRTHMKVHKWTAYAIVALTALHAILALILFNGWRIF
jgi:hypothetical protein